MESDNRKQLRNSIQLWFDYDLGNFNLTSEKNGTTKKCNRIGRPM